VRQQARSEVDAVATKQWNPGRSDWIAFAALILLIAGVLNVAEGIVTLLYRDRTAVVADRLYLVDVVGWGILVLVLGAVLLCAGAGVLSGRTWARVVAIVLTAVHAVVQVASLGAYPVWSLLMLGLDVIVLYALAARWHEAMTAGDEFTPSATYDPRDQQAVWEQHPRMIV
jgi:hypothetical protein